MYFKDRKQAGEKLAEQLKKYIDDDVVVIALSDGGVEIGELVASALRCKLSFLLSREIEIPGENEVIGTVDQSGEFTYNSSFSEGLIDEYVSEFHGVIEAAKLVKVHEINQVLGDHKFIGRKGLKDKIVILVSDGVKRSTVFDAAMNFLKPVRLKKLVVATPLASVPAVDRMHIIADELHVLSVVDNYLETDHYFKKNTSLPHKAALNRVEKLLKKRK